MIQFDSKANTLLSLRKKLKYAKVLPMYIFTTKEWYDDEEKVYRSIINCSWFSWPVIVRSSHFKEDSQLESLAGHFDSVLDVANKEQLFLAIKKVLNSYKSKFIDNQIFIQPMLKNVEISGVVLSHDINSSAPYLSINYDDTSKDTTSITSGKRINKNHFFHHSANGPTPKKLIKVILMAQELFQLANSIPIDIEFAIDSSKECYLLQIRKLVITKNKNYSIESHTRIIKGIEKKIQKFKKKHPYLLGNKTIFGIMSDWNPAEMIGVRPRPLSLSLYQNLITDSTWAYQRDNYGYRKLRGIPLMQNFSGIPFIDLRVSFNSFIPKSLDKKIAEKLVNYYLRELIKKPHLHDKIEFEIAFTCFTFKTSTRMKKLLDNNFNNEEIRKIKSSLIDLTNNIINYKTGIWRIDLKKIKELTTRRKKIEESSLSIEEKIFFLLEDCRRYGTLPFAGLARVGFISIEFLNSLVDSSIISESDKQNFLLSLQTITTSLSNDIVKMNKNIFLKKYGHLRPGTYDIRSKRYDENYNSYFRYHTMNNKSLVKNKFKLKSSQIKSIKMKLDKNNIDYNVKHFFKFLKEGIEAREFAKFEFTKNVSLILQLIKKMGMKYGFSRDDCSFLDIRIIDKLMNSNKDIKALLSDSIKRGKKEFSETESLNLPGLIFKKNDIWSFSQLRSEPNFITQKKVIGQIQIASEEKVNLSNKIVFINSADPGYDWIFTKKILGLVTKYGGANSHMAIRANELGIPSVIGSGDQYYDFWLKFNYLSIDCSKKKVEVLS